MIYPKINNLSIREKILQMFILGFSGTELSNSGHNIQNLVGSGLGGVIYFAENIISYEQTAALSKDLQKISKTPLFISIDQEGGRVERTGNIKNKEKYLSPKELAEKNSMDLIKQQTQIMVKELKSMGINMNFAPVLDVNTNEMNPIIGVRSFGNNPDDVIKYSEPVYKILNQNNIIAVGKHFPGHGDTSVDSHIDLPVVDLPLDELENIHIKPFKSAIDNGLNAIMAAHVFYKAFGKQIPSSLSKEIITDYLKIKLGYKGLVISDDMIMGGISKNYSSLEACIKGINAGIDIYIYRNSNDEIIKLINDLEEAVIKNLIPISRINESVEKIFLIKEKYKII